MQFILKIFTKHIISMKKQMIILAAIIGAVGTSSASMAPKKTTKKTISTAAVVAVVPQKPQIEIKDKLDSLSYSIGMAETRGLKEYATTKMGLDTVYFQKFVEGVEAGSKDQSASEKAYNLGINIGMQIASQNIAALNKELFEDDSTKTVNKDLFIEGFITAIKGQDGRIKGGVDAAVEYVPGAMDQLKHAALTQRYAANKAAGELFLDQNKKKDSVITTTSGLQYKVLVKGNGSVPTADQQVKVNYRGKLLDGKEFDSSYSRKQPATFKASEVIKGWTEALTLMPVGSKWELYIPYQLAYGERNMGPIKPFSALIFEVELLDIVKPAPKAEVKANGTKESNKKSLNKKRNK